MSVTNNGNQVLSFDYKHNATGRSFNTLLKNILKPGIYSGGILSKINNSTIAISPFDIWINFTDDSGACHVSTSTPVQLIVTEAYPVLYMTLDWVDAVDNYLDFSFRAVGSPVVTNEIQIGVIGFTGGIVDGTFTYSNRTYGITDEDFSIYTPEIVYTDTIREYTSGNGIGIDTIKESTLNHGVDIETVHLENGRIEVPDTTDSTSKDTGALVIEGGIGIEKSVNIGGSLTVGQVSWTSAQLVGSGLSITGISTPALCALNGTDVAFIDSTLESLRCYRFNGSTWSLVGSRLSITGMSSPALCALNGTDVAFIDNALESLQCYRFGFSISGSPYHP